MIMPYLHQFVLLSNVLMCMMLQNSLETQILMLLGLWTTVIAYHQTIHLFVCPISHSKK